MKRKDIKDIRMGLFILNENFEKLRYGMIEKGIIDNITDEQLEIMVKSDILSKEHIHICIWCGSECEDDSFVCNKCSEEHTLEESVDKLKSKALG